MAKRLRKSELEENLSEVLGKMVREVDRIEKQMQDGDSASALYIKAMDTCVSAHVRALAGGHFVPDEAETELNSKDKRAMLIRVEAMAARLRSEVANMDAEPAGAGDTVQ